MQKLSAENCSAKKERLTSGKKAPPSFVVILNANTCAVGGKARLLSHTHHAHCIRNKDDGNLFYDATFVLRREGSPRRSRAPFVCNEKCLIVC